MKCSVCAQDGVNSIALRYVGRHGFCRAHYAEACKAELANRERKRAFAIRNLTTQGHRMTYQPTRASKSKSTIHEKIQQIRASDFQPTTYVGNTRTIELKR